MRRAVFFLALVLGGCFRDADPLELDANPVQVHAILEAGADSVTVLLSRPGSDRFSYRPISGADVKLSSAAGTAQLHELVDGTACAEVGVMPVGTGSGCYTAKLGAPIQAGELYELDVRLLDGARVSGQARVPAAVQFTSTGTSHIVECPPVQWTSCASRFSDTPPYAIEPLTIIEATWHAPAGVARVDAMLRPTRMVKDGTVYPGRVCQVDPQTLFGGVEAPRGRIVWPVYSIHCAGPQGALDWDTIHIATTVVVHDSASATYLDAVLERDAARIEFVSAGLQGALGVFGSVNPRELEFTLIRATKTGS